MLPTILVTGLRDNMLDLGDCFDLRWKGAGEGDGRPSLHSWTAPMQCMLSWEPEKESICRKVEGDKDWSSLRCPKEEVPAGQVARVPSDRGGRAQMCPLILESRYRCGQ